LLLAVLAIPAKSSSQANHAIKSAKHMVDYLSDVLFLICTHCVNTTAKMCFDNSLFEETVWLLARKSSLDFLKIAENF